ncbi:SAM-dependent methyltransferase [Hamadaea flava]|uniref:Class I SAM-dependent methyltransferase n=1 Tax=Hamadaea flava TaxID=1742688 RepID=A0ABV8LTQ5_9ACTN|nr:class I SAM-dependent methyltransferase [Hamadaea flava]MCP2321735.1 SAM-dependent methyltransferase [Hamadaea flava]
MLLRVLADGVPIDCGGVADGFTGCYGKLPAIGIAAVATIAAAAVVGHAVLAALVPQLFNAMTGVPTGGGEGLLGGGSPTVKVGGLRVPVLPSIGPSVPFAGRVLLVGEGNFSFTAANLGLGRAIPQNVTATAYSPDGRFPPDVLSRADQLRAMGANVRLQVDARNLPADLAGGAPFNTVIFQFPHPGGPRTGASVAGRQLMRDFFASAAQRLAPGGKVVLTLRNQHYVSHWRPAEAAAAAGLRLESVTEFHQGHYPGYGHVTTSAGATSPDVSQGFTFVFTRG